MQVIDVSKLIFDPELYPRKNFDSHNVTRLREAIECGETLPPIIACKDTLRVVDGMHRLRAYQGLGIEEAPVELREYESESELFIEAIRLNATHGAKLDRWDQTRCIHRADELKISTEDTAAALCISVDRAERIRLIRTAYDSKGKPVELKRTYIAKYQGKRMPKKAIEAMESDQGWPVAFHAKQILNAQKGGVIDWSDEETVAVLRQLADMILEELSVAQAM